MDKLQNKKLFFEICRYLIIGGFAFLVDSIVLIFFQEIVLHKNIESGIYISIALGFIAGLIFNYIFSIIFVFKDVKDKNSGKTISAFMIFAVIGIIGLGMTELFLSQ